MIKNTSETGFDGAPGYSSSRNGIPCSVFGAIEMDKDVEVEDDIHTGPDPLIRSPRLGRALADVVQGRLRQRKRGRHKTYFRV